jgi:NADH-quinone oxidoreductase subunit I
MGKPVARLIPSFETQSYLPELARGLAVTTRQLVRNVFGRKDTVTTQYPEHVRPYAERFRGHHRLMHRDDGQVRCVACMLCSTACPANCIHIEAAEHEDASLEKYPVRFEIDLLLCIYCGFCEEACPCDAIRMDSGEHPKPLVARAGFKTHKVDLLGRGSQSIAVQGGNLK